MALFAHSVASKASDQGSVHEASWWQVAIVGFRQGGARCASFYSIRFRPRGSRQTAIVIAAFTLILTFVFFVSVPLVSELFVCCSFRLCSAVLSELSVQDSLKFYRVRKSTLRFRCTDLNFFTVRERDPGKIMDSCEAHAYIPYIAHMHVLACAGTGIPGRLRGQGS